MSDGKNVKRGHRGYVTRTINKAKDIIKNFQEKDRFRLKGIQNSLKQKSGVLHEFDTKVLRTLKDNDAIYNKIDTSNDFSMRFLCRVLIMRKQ